MLLSVRLRIIFIIDLKDTLFHVSNGLNTQNLVTMTRIAIIEGFVIRYPVLMSANHLTCAVPAASRVYRCSALKRILMKADSDVIKKKSPLVSLGKRTKGRDILLCRLCVCLNGRKVRGKVNKKRACLPAAINSIAGETGFNNSTYDAFTQRQEHAF